MRLMNLISLQKAMVTKQLMRAARFEACRPFMEEQRSKSGSLRMKWIVTTDENGTRQLRMCWRADRESRSAPDKALTNIVPLDSMASTVPRRGRNLTSSSVASVRTTAVAVMIVVIAAWATAAAAQENSDSRSELVAQNALTPTNATDSVASAIDPPSSGASDVPGVTVLPHLADTRFWLSGQANFIFQTHAPFRAAYSGVNSLNPSYEKASSRVLTLYTGLRLDNSTELLVDIEEAGGGALSTGLGIAGFPNLDIVRNPSLSKAPYLARGMIHKVFALSSDKIENERNPLSLFEELPRRRLEIRFGKFSMVDFFDANSAGSDTHLQFTNWAIDNNGAYDYAADTRGYTVGFTADYEERNWGLRFADGLMPKVANGIDLVWKPWQAHAENLEYELRHGVIPKRAGVIRLLAFTNYANMGVYRDAVTQFDKGLVPVPDITNHPWHITRKYGLGLNVEQTLTRQLTAFARFGWNNGRTESFAYTEIDQTFAAGLGAHGSMWHRRWDRAGFAFVTNGISKDHQVYLADGGHGFLLGDGALNYGRENIIETYYTAHLWRGLSVAPGLQHIVNPGYNRDRGPVLVPSFRLHLEL